MGYEVYSGIFADEVCIRYMLALRDHMLASFGKVWEACREKEGASALFAQCMSKVPVWGDDVFRDERAAFVLANSSADELNRATFIAYARNVHQRPGAPKVRIRMTVPPLLTVVRSFLISASKMPLVQSGEVFSTRPIDVKDLCIESLRAALSSLQEEHVYVERGEAVPAAAEAGIEPWESASNVSSASSKSTKSSHQSSHKTVSVATKGVFAQHLSEERKKRKADSEVSSSKSMDRAIGKAMSNVSSSTKKSKM